MVEDRGGTPRFSIVTPVYEPPIDVLAETLDSVQAQTFEDWEWILVDDASPSAGARELIASRSETDDRIRLVSRRENGHIVVSTNEALDHVRGEFVVFLDHDDLLTEDALERVEAAIAAHEDVDYVYSDEDKVGEDGEFFDHFAKPDWSPERLRGQMYTSHLSAVRTDVVEQVGRLREGFDGSQDHDLILRVGEVARRVVHIRKVLYHWRSVPGSAAADIHAKPYATIAGQKAVQSHLDRVGVRATVRQGTLPGHYVVERELDPERRVSVVIPTLGQSAMIFGARRVMVVEAVRSALECTSHENLEFVIVYDDPTPTRVLDQLRELAGDRLTLLPFHRAFNYSEKMNLGVLRSTGDRVVFLNDDIEAISNGWLEQLVAPLDDPEVGLTGAKLYFSDQTVQHAGHGYWKGHYHHPYRYSARSDPGPFGALFVNREVTGVTAACAAMRRDVFLEVGGFAEGLPVNFNDVDLCYKVRRTGYRILWIANSELYHFESKTRKPVVADWERRGVVERWGIPIADDFTDHRGTRIHG